MLPLLVLLTLLALPAVALSWLPAPFLWISVGWALFFFLRIRPNRARRRGPVYLTIGAALLAFAAVEAVFLVQDLHPVQKANEGEGEKLTRDDDVLGYAPSAGARRHVRAEVDGETLYEVDYTIGDDGLRVAPPTVETGASESILFFGGSYTFGEGVNDDETLPYRTGELLGGRVRPYNFAFFGYGPHHMLASVEHGRVASTVKAPPRHAVYLAITDHVDRAAGPKPWDPHGPRYVLEPDGSVRFDGHFDDPRPPPQLSLGEELDRAVRHELRKSYLLRRLVRYRAKTPGDVALWAGIVADTRRRLEALYPGIEFHVLVWDSPYVDWEPLHAALAAGGQQTHRASRILPGFEDDFRAWLLGAKDRHPNARAYDGLAAYVAREIVGP